MTTLSKQLEVATAGAVALEAENARIASERDDFEQDLAELRAFLASFEDEDGDGIPDVLQIASPPPDIEPEPEPEPEPGPDGRPAARSKDLGKLYSMVCLREYNPQWRYVRWSKLMKLKDPEVIELKGSNNVVEYNRMRASGGKVNFAEGVYTLLCDGEPIATDEPGTDVSKSAFHVDVTGLAEGWHVLDFRAPDGTTIESVFYPVYVLHGDKVSVDQVWMPVVTGPHHHRMAGMHRMFWVPAKYDPVLLPKKKREYPKFSEAVDGAKLWHGWLIPPHESQSVQPLIDKHGIINTFGLYRYKIAYIHDLLPSHPIIEGQRGKACQGMFTDIEIGEAVIDELGGLRHNTYVLDPFGMSKVSEDGAVTRLVGWIHDGDIPSYWEDEQKLRLIGDWSAIPKERWGMRNAWGMGRDSFSMRVDTTAEKVPLEGAMVAPHPENPTWYIADTMGPDINGGNEGRILKVEFDGTAHGIPPKVTEFIVGIKGPFDVKEYQPDPNKRGTLIVSIREEHRIAEYSMETGEFIRDVVSGAPLAYVHWTREVVRTADLDTIRKQDCVCPDGIYVMGDWLYFGSVAMMQVRRVHLQTGEIQVVVPEVLGNIRTKWYLKIAVSDGTAGPRHTVFICRWDNVRFGQPDVCVPHGQDTEVAAEWDMNEWVLMKSGSAGISQGLGMMQDGLGYNMAVAAKNGRIVWSTVDWALYECSLGLPTDPVCDTKLFLRGKNEYNEKGYDLVYGKNGMGFYGEPLPWDESEAIDYYLAWFGHERAMA